MPESFNRLRMVFKQTVSEKVLLPLSWSSILLTLFSPVESNLFKNNQTPFINTYCCLKALEVCYHQSRNLDWIVILKKSRMRCKIGRGQWNGEEENLRWFSLRKPMLTVA